MPPDTDPFATPPEQRDPARRLRGRLTSPVTVWTAGGPGEATGLTVSSIIVAEGAPPSVGGIINPLSDLWDALQETRAFVVHVLDRTQRDLGERFAGRMPSPGGLFRDLSVEHSDWGPVLTGVANRARCRLTATHEIGYHELVVGTIEAVDTTDFEDPLAYFLGRYRALKPRGDA
jgi:3-hydroxy-9,10-secoandrosta-1,3,5(10)-triene-9,17-dione monooxygenase reductase component